MRVHVTLLAMALLLSSPVHADKTDDEAATFAKIQLLGGRIIRHDYPDDRRVSITFENVGRMNERFLHLLKRVENLRALEFIDVRISDAGFQNIGELTELYHLNVVNSPELSDEGLKQISGLKKLKSLLLAGCTRITDRGIKELGELENLTHLYLFGTRITDAGLQELARLKHLKVVDFRDVLIFARRGSDGKAKWDYAVDARRQPNISDRGIAQLKATLPGLQINR